MKKIIKNWLGIIHIEKELDHTHEIAHELIDKCDAGFEAVQAMTEKLAEIIGYTVVVKEEDHKVDPKDIYVTESPTREASIYLVKNVTKKQILDLKVNKMKKTVTKKK